MTTQAPLPDCHPELVLYVVKHLLTRSVSIVPRPAPEDEIKVLNYFFGFHRWMLSQPQANTLEQVKYLHLLWLHETRTTMLPNVETKKVKSILDMNNLGLLRV